MYDRILVPTDGSEYAEDAAERAFALAETTDASIHVVCVVDRGPLGSVRLPGDDASAADAFAERAAEFVARLEERARERGLEVDTEIREGVPVQELLACADEVGAAAVVMGTRGRGGVSRMMLGSVTDGVVRQGDVDVLVVGD